MGSPILSTYAAKLSDLHDVFGLGTLRAVSHFELHLLPLDQGLVAISGDRTIMYEYILLARLLDKTVAFRIVKPFDLADSL